MILRVARRTGENWGGAGGAYYCVGRQNASRRRDERFDETLSTNIPEDIALKINEQRRQRDDVVKGGF